MDPYYEIKELSCQFCSRFYSKRENIPMIMSCSHSSCLLCLNKFNVYESLECSECYLKIKHELLNEFPVNREILEEIESYLSPTYKSHLLRSEEILKDFDNQLDEVNEAQEKLRRQLDDLERELEETIQQERQNFEAKINLQRTKDNLCANSISQSIRLLKEAGSTINHYENENQMILDNLKMAHQKKYFQSFFDSPKSFFISSENRRENTTFYTVGSLMYINSFPQQLSSEQNSEIKLEVLKPFIKKAFITFGFEGYSSLVEFEFFDLNCLRAQNFIKRCLGDENNSFLNANTYNHERIGLEGESFQIGIKEDRESITEPGINDGCQKMDYIRRGYITANEFGEEINHFKIYLETWPSRSCYPCIGRVTKGLKAIKSATKNRLKLNILECGVIADLPLN